jgi:hypothetical protein
VRASGGGAIRGPTCSFARLRRYACALLAGSTFTGCNALSGLVEDRCETLCRSVGTEITSCGALSWTDFGAESRTEFVGQCQDDWNAERLDLTASDLRRALDDCDATLEILPELSCQEYVALFGGEL